MDQALEGAALSSTTAADSVICIRAGTGSGSAATSATGLQRPRSGSGSESESDDRAHLSRGRVFPEVDWSGGPDWAEAESGPDWDGRRGEPDSESESESELLDV